VSRGRIASIRGVNVDGVVRTLLTRGLAEEAGQDPETGALLYQTTSYFLERLGLRSIADLPPLAPFLPDEASLATILEGDQWPTPTCLTASACKKSSPMRAWVRAGQAKGSSPKGG